MRLVFDCHGLADIRDHFASISQERQTMQQSCGSQICCRLPYPQMQA